MTSEGLGEMFEDDSADMCAVRSCRWGPSGGSSVHRPGSEDLHRSEWKSMILLYRGIFKQDKGCSGSNASY